jgi:hypothetical protein
MAKKDEEQAAPETISKMEAVRRTRVRPTDRLRWSWAASQDGGRQDGVRRSTGALRGDDYEGKLGAADRVLAVLGAFPTTGQALAGRRWALLVGTCADTYEPFRAAPA